MISQLNICGVALSQHFLWRTVASATQTRNIWILYGGAMFMTLGVSFAYGGARGNHS
jgi:hypothetical protein